MFLTTSRISNGFSSTMSNYGHTKHVIPWAARAAHRAFRRMPNPRCSFLSHLMPIGIVDICFRILSQSLIRFQISLVALQSKKRWALLSSHILQRTHTCNMFKNLSRSVVFSCPLTINELKISVVYNSSKSSCAKNEFPPFAGDAHKQPRSLWLQTIHNHCKRQDIDR